MKIAPIDLIEFRGGRLCLDFVNTANWINDVAVDNRLVDLGAVRIWVTRKRLTEAAQLNGDLNELLHFRDTMRRIINNPDEVSNEDLTIVNHARACVAAPMLSVGGKLQIDPGPSLDWVLRIIADSTTELMLTTKKSRIKLCHGDRCGWLFLDESPNNRRRWCSMADCGNRAKAKRHYNSVRQAAVSS